jgi:transcriptional regulator with XRE-family HTH domain
MENLQSLSSRLTHIREHLGLSLRDFARCLDVSHSAIADYEKGKGLSRIHTIKQLASTIEQHYGISADWLLTGEGTLFTNRQSLNLISLPLVSPRPIVETGNALEGYANTRNCMTFDKDWLRASFGVDPQNLCIMQVTGNSMAPTIAPDEYVFIDGLHDLPEYRDGVWITRLGDNLLIKRIQLLAAGEYRVTSDNPAYQPIRLDTAAQILGRVLGGRPHLY